MGKLRVGVFMGGKSIEREVSFNSGRTVCDHLDTARYEIIPIFQTTAGNLYMLPWHFLVRGKIADFEHRLARQAQEISWDDLKNLVDFIYIAVHGKYAEDGTLQGMLEILDIPYLGSDIFASALCMDKAVQKIFLTQQGIEVPRSITVSPHELTQPNVYASIVERMATHNLIFPCVVKPSQEGSSLGVSIVESQDQLEQALKAACYADPSKPQNVLIEEKIEGMEFSCITITDYKTNTLMPLPPTEIVPEVGTQFFDYEQKYMPGRASKFTPPRTNEATIKKIQDTCVAVTKILGLTNISRIDGFVTHNGRVVIVDPNTISGMGPSSFLFREAAEINMSHTQLINHLIETELQEYNMLNDGHRSEQDQKKRATKLRVAVLLGGNSNEREISLESGRNICYKLSPDNYEVTPLFVNDALELYKLNQSQLVRNSTKEIASILKSVDRIAWHDLPQLFDFVFIGLHGGYGENGGAQGALEMLGVPYNGSGVLASALCMDKFKTTEFLRAHGFHVPHGMLVAKSAWIATKTAVLENIITTLPLPLIIKPHDDGCSVMVQKITRKEDIAQALDALFSNQKEYALVEECITGMELTVGVIGNDKPQALAPSQAVATAGILSIEEKFLPGAGENQTPAPLPAEALRFVQHTMEQAYRTLGCKGYARIDCFYQSKAESPTGNERVIIIEVNTLPGMTPATCIFHQAAELGIKPMDFINTIVQLGLEEHQSPRVVQQSEYQERKSV